MISEILYYCIKKQEAYEKNSDIIKCVKFEESFGLHRFHGTVSNCTIQLVYFN